MSSTVLIEEFFRPLITKATKFVSKMHLGGSSPCLFDCEAGQHVVKFKHNGQGARLVINELLGCLLALHLGVLCPSPAIVELPSEIIQATPQILSVDHGGKNFGSLMLDNQGGETFAQVAGLPANQRNLTGMMIADLWLMNTDRNENNLIIHQQKVHAIDFGHIFGGPGWTTGSLKQHANDFGTWPFKSLVCRASVTDFLTCLEGLKPERILSVIAQIPDEWLLTEEEKDAVFHFLLQRQPLLRGHIAKLGL